MELQNDMKKMKYDIYHPLPGHEARFAKKLAAAFPSAKRERKMKYLWMAASIVIFLGLGVLSFSVNKPLSETDQVMQKNTAYFSAIIKKEIMELDKLKNPEADHLVNETMAQLNKLEKEYKKIAKDFRKNNDNKNLLNAMIENFKKRIELLEFTKFQLREIQKQKSNNHEQNKA